MKKLLFTAKNLKIGGMEKALVVLLNSLVDNYKITLILEEKIGVLEDQLDDRIKVREYKISNFKISFIRKIINFSKRVLWLLHNYHCYDFSCCYATYSIIGSKLALIGSKNSSLYVHSNYYGYFNGQKEKINDFFESLSYKKFKNLIFVSNESKNQIQDVISYNKKHLLVINNLTDYKSIVDGTLERSDLSMFSQDNINLLFVGRLDNTSKNFDLLLDSFSLVKNKRIKLFILGDGYYKENIMNKIEELDLNDRVELLGERINPYPYMKYCDALIITSRYEGFPLIYNEALVLNKKVITTVPVSDSFIDIKDYFSCVNATKEDISNAIDALNKEKVNYFMSFDKINEANLRKLITVIESDGECENEERKTND